MKAESTKKIEGGKTVSLNGNWWWRDFDFKGFKAFYPMDGVNWSVGFEQFKRSAYLYEMTSRLNGKYLFGKPWNKLDINIRFGLSLHWPTEGVERPVWVQTQSISFPQEATDALPFRFDLRANDAAILRCFSMWLAEQRRRKGIRNPRPNKGKKNRFSWKPLELEDIEASKFRLLNDSERSQLSKAKSAAKLVALPRAFLSK